MLGYAIRFGLLLLLRNPARVLRTGAGLAVAVLIVLVESAFWTSVSDAHLRLISAAQADLFLFDFRRHHLNKWDRLSWSQMVRANGVAGVQSVKPVYQSGVTISTTPDGAPKRIIAVAFPTESIPLDIGLSPATLRLLAEPDTVAYDSGSRPIFGDIHAGSDVWINEQRMHVVGTAVLGPNLINDGTVILSDGNMNKLTRGTDPIMGLVTIRPGSNRDDIQKQLSEMMAPFIQVLSREQLILREDHYLGRIAPVGVLFGAGAVAGLLVGAVICYQSFFMAIRRQGKAFATLSAMGASKTALATMVLAQALVLSMFAFGLAWAGAEGIAWWIRATLSAPASLKPELLWPAAIAVVLTCAVSAWLALRHSALKQADQLY
jgi:putative ABC transport system permease protein